MRQDYFRQQWGPREADLLTLHRNWENGVYTAHAEQLRGFVREKHESLRVLATTPPIASLVEAAKLLVVQLGTVHPRSEMRDQVRAIHDEIWFRGEEGFYDRHRIADDWARLHAPAWRRWRTIEYLYVLERIAGELPGLVSAAAEDGRRTE